MNNYQCYLNGVFYGGGDAEFMVELFTDYVLLKNMYGKKDCDFRIVRFANDKINGQL
ncbi:hypothetical protein [Sporolactobacillus sp. KGMB 08714]|uniref:hypothetical protein n=1 Tax=Sporolactobacillus sp. KGMB 08714 TaxID=3064704 RepID=UPI002FBE830D